MPVADTSTRTVERALLLLGAVCERGSVTLADAARDAGLSASTALRLLRTLESTGFVRRDDAGGYRPGLRVVQLGAQALSSESLVSLAEGSLERLVRLTGESAYLSVPSTTTTASTSPCGKAPTRCGTRAGSAAAFP
jgi:urocanate hydratase